MRMHYRGDPVIARDLCACGCGDIELILVRRPNGTVRQIEVPYSTRAKKRSAAVRRAWATRRAQNDSAA